eukprot:symbB.v1.2.014985.t1/scaffold1107.1/size155946/19
MNLLEELFKADGFSFQAISIDDFYLPATWQEEVANVYANNALMQTRGNAGTHDVQLGTQTIKALKSADEAEVLVPHFDKSARSGRGDQVPKHSWTPVHTPCDVVVLEGWMLGFKPCDSQVAANVHPDLRLVNEKLKRYQAWDDLIDCFCVFAMEEIDQVYSWRSQAEDAMKRSGRGGMSQEEVKDFVDRYMPAYFAYRPGLYASASQEGVDGKPSWLCHVGVGGDCEAARFFWSNFSHRHICERHLLEANLPSSIWMGEGWRCNQKLVRYGNRTKRRRHLGRASMGWMPFQGKMQL